MIDHREPPASDGDDIGALVRLAGRRPEVPDEVVRRARETARAAWHRGLRRRALRKRRWAAGLAAAASLLVVFAFWGLRGGTVGGDQGAILVEGVEGEARLQQSEGAGGELVVGDAVARGATVVTGRSGRAALRLPSGHSVRLDVSTTVRTVSDGLLELKAGALYVDSGTESGGEGLEVRTPLARLEEVGTQFEVRLLPEGVRLRVREGGVRLHRGEAAEVARAGTELSVGADGTVRRRRIDLHGDAWEWIAATMPPWDLEGRTAREFLDRVAREGGWLLTFDDPAVAHAADETVLGGRIGDLGPREALDAVLPTCRMSYRLEDGVLVVSRAR